jgi:site-specific DNA recombinase
MPSEWVTENPLAPIREVTQRMRAVFYLRVSSKSQVRTDHNPEGISIPAQRVRCGEKAESIDADVVGEYVEPGVSAFKDLAKRTAFRAMISRIEEHGDVDIVIVYMLSRFARDRYEDAEFTMRLRNLGVLLVSATENIDETPSGELLHGIMAAINQYQSASAGKDISYKMTQKATTGGTPGLAPIGYLNERIRSEPFPVTVGDAV